MSVSCLGDTDDRDLVERDPEPLVSTVAPLFDRGAESVEPRFPEVAPLRQAAVNRLSAEPPANNASCSLRLRRGRNMLRDRPSRSTVAAAYGSAARGLQVDGAVDAATISIAAKSCVGRIPADERAGAPAAHYVEP